MKNLLFLLLWCCATIATAQKITTPNIQPAAKVACSIALTATVTEAGCTGQSNGTVSLFAANGATPYAYAWSNGATTANLTNLAVGLYTVTVTDALGCTATKIANIQNGSPINANNTANGNPSTIPIMACVGDVIKFSSSGVIPTGTAVEWYISPTAAFTPPTGTYIGTTNTTLCPTICPKIQVIFIDACNGTTSEFDNEYMVFTSGDGFQADNLQVKYSNSSLAGNAALNIGANACALQVPQAALITALRAGACNASNIIPVNPGSTVPAGGVVVLFCSKAVTAPYNFNSLCASGKKVYIMQSGCQRTGGAFTNVWSGGAGTCASPAGDKTTTLSLNNCSTCSDALTYSLCGLTGADGNYAIRLPNNTISSRANGGILNNTASPCNGANFSTLNLPNNDTLRFNYTIPAALCNTKRFVRGVFVPSNSCPTVTDAFELTVTCPIVMIAPTAPLCGQTVGSASAAVMPAGLPTYLWNTGATTATASNLSAGGTYTVTATSGGCSTTASFVMASSGSSNIVTIGATQAVCGTSLGSATAASSIGTPTYLWSDGQTTATAINLAAGIYTVSATDAGGCTATAICQIIQTPPFPVTASVANTNCNGATGSITLTLPVINTLYTFLWSNNATNNPILGLAAGTYTCTVTNSSNCAQTISATVQSNNGAILTTTATVTANCGQADGAATVSATGGGAPYSYLWDDGEVNATAIGLRAGLHTVSVTDVNGCVVVANITINTTAPIQTTLNLTNNTACTGLCNGSGTTSTTGGIPPYTYLWSNNETTSNVINLCGGSYGVRVVDSKGCASAPFGNITNSSPMSITFINIIATRCAGQSNGNATAQVLGGTSPYSYLWDNGATTATSNTLSSGVHYVTVTEAQGCTTSASVSIPSAVPFIYTPILVQSPRCKGGKEVQLSGSLSGGSLPFSFLWSNGQTLGMPDSLAAGIYTVTTTDAAGCISISQLTVPDGTAPNITSVVVGQNIACSGGTGEVTATASGANPLTYLWNNNVNTAINNNVIANTYTVTVSDGNGCKASKSVVLPDAPPIIISISNLTNIKCAGQSNGTATATATSLNPTSGYTYLWDGGSTNNIRTNLTSGTHTVTATNANGCTAQTTITVTEPLALSLTFPTVTNAACGGTQRGQIVAQAVGGTPNYTYLWNTSGGGNTLSSLPAGTYSVTVTDQNGCQISGMQLIADTPKPTIDSIVGKAVSCAANTDGKLTVFAANGTPTYTYNWNNGAATAANTGIGAGVYTVTVSDARACTVTASSRVTTPLPITATATATRPVCYDNATGRIVITNITNAQNTATLLYSIDGGTLARDSVFAAVLPGAHTVRLLDERNCDWTKNITVPFGLPFTVAASNDTTINIGGTCALAATPNIYAPLVYAWSPVAGLSCSTCQRPTAAPISTTQYIVTATDSNGCTATDAVTVQVNAKYNVYVPNTFTPNNDGTNDGFTVYGGNAATLLTFLRIFDRWGTLIYETTNGPPNDPTKGWNGTYKGVLLGSDVFVYYTEVQFIDGTRKVFKGDITLLR